MIPAGQLSGAVMAGGHSRRMGRDKAALLLGEIPLWQRQLNLLRVAGAGVIAVVRRPEQDPLELPSDIPLWTDTVPGIGPLAGIHTALMHCPTPWLAIVATDMPKLEAAWFLSLGSYCDTDRGAIVCRSDGTYEPLAAIYPRTALAHLTPRLAGPDHSLQALAKNLVELKLLVSLPLAEANAWQVENWNTPADRVLNAAKPT